ncbi:hypothetical protein A3C98_04125 [Candidatus Roizmanbacteria bacterium RIFCSPHIGHO2_02_FULL_37_15]|nr:MAG: hypothetical protein A3C98_04125 [Candidatus Roizmanbacteria bacterium RIFCSPHIGHO2_02_FULL_37_15]
MMSKIKKIISILKYLQVVGYLSLVAPAYAQDPTIMVNENAIGFKIPSLGDILTFMIRAFFIIAGLAALLFLLTGALSWVTSGGNKENVDKARDKITSAITGLIIIVAVLAVIVTFEQVIFANRLCLGLSCPITIPPLLQPPGS